MPYIPHTAKDITKILEAVGADSVESVLGSIPAGLRLREKLALPSGLSEQELASVMKGLAAKNSTVDEYDCYLGAGAYNHYIPAVVASLAGRSEFFTSYTPYQPEVSQGTLQAVFEYQTLVCQLTGMDVSNASLYDGASAVAEAVLMARRITRRSRVMISGGLHPEYAETVRTYLQSTPDDITEVEFSGQTGATTVDAAADVEEPACLVVQSPNFFGSIEDVASLADFIHSKNGLLIVVVTEPVSLGLLKSPGELGADIAVGENQSFGNPLNFGGPYLGFMATREKFIRQMPGRLVGQTVDNKGNTAYCLTFATREQHIRRERATSNICTNHGLCALAASIHMTSLGKTGLKDLARLNLSKAEYLKGRLTAVAGVELAFSSPTFNELTLKLVMDPDEVLKALLDKKIIGGLALKRFYPELSGHLLVAATEMNTKEEMDRFAAELAAALKCAPSPA